MVEKLCQSENVILCGSVNVQLYLKWNNEQNTQLPQTTINDKNWGCLTNMARCTFKLVFNEDFKSAEPFLIRPPEYNFSLQSRTSGGRIQNGSADLNSSLKIDNSISCHIFQANQFFIVYHYMQFQFMAWPANNAILLFSI